MSTQVVETIKIEIQTSENDYVRVFDTNNLKWRTQGDVYNQFFLHALQNYFNEVLRNRGYVFLNEVLSALGYDHTQVGAVVGWSLKNDDPYVDFGLDDNSDPEKIDLKFNVNGVIVDKI